jgi:PhnB protein
LRYSPTLLATCSESGKKPQIAGARGKRHPAQLWVDRPPEAIAFYQAAFSATVVHQVREGEDIVAQLAVGDACFWVASADPEKGRFSAAAIDGGTSRTLLVTSDPDNMVSAAFAAGGATVTSPVGDEHGWRLGRITDPFGHHWEIGTPIGPWPP